jgi:hypothetical protein
LARPQCDTPLVLFYFILFYFIFKFVRWVLGGLANHPPEDLAKKFDYKSERREVEKG